MMSLAYLLTVRYDRVFNLFHHKFMHFYYNPMFIFDTSETTFHVGDIVFSLHLHLCTNLYYIVQMYFNFLKLLIFLKNLFS